MLKVIEVVFFISAGGGGWVVVVGVYNISDSCDSGSGSGLASNRHSKFSHLGILNFLFYHLFSHFVRFF